MTALWTLAERPANPSCQQLSSAISHSLLSMTALLVTLCVQCPDPPSAMNGG
jgi:hypothetical protein